MKTILYSATIDDDRLEIILNYINAFVISVAPYVKNQNLHISNDKFDEIMTKRPPRKRKG